MPFKRSFKSAPDLSQKGLLARPVQSNSIFGHAKHVLHVEKSHFTPLEGELTAGDVFSGLKLNSSFVDYGSAKTAPSPLFIVGMSRLLTTLAHLLPSLVKIVFRLFI